MDMDMLKVVGETGVIGVLLFFFAKTFFARDAKREEQISIQQKNYVEREQIFLAEATRREEILRLESEKREKILRQEAEKRETNLMLSIEGYGRTMEKISDTMNDIKSTLSELKMAYTEMQNEVTNIKSSLESTLERQVQDGREGNNAGEGA